MRALLQKIRQLLRDRRFRRIWYRSVSSIAALIVFATTYALVLPAITMESQAACGMEAHQHDDSCYEKRLTCGLAETAGHTHTEACYEKVLVCGKEAHIHNTECYREDSTAVAASTGSIVADSANTDAHTDDTNHVYSSDPESAGNTDNVGIHSPQAADDTQKDAGTWNEDDTQNVDGTQNAGGAATGMTCTPTDGIEISTAAMTTDVLPDSMESESLSDGYVPVLEPLNFSTILNKHTGFYYFHVEDGQEIPADSGQITDWKKVDQKTELASADLLRAYFAYSIPAGSLNETNQIARYRLPANLHLTDDQVMAINNNVNGIAAGFVDPSTGNIPDEDYDRYQMYLGAEAVERTRTPDMLLRDGTQEYISAVVKAENVYENTLDENGRYVDADGNITDDPGALIGQDLIFVFTPYTIEKNQVTYDQDGKPVTAGEKVTGWFACDFNMSQIDWAENETDLDNSSLEKTAEVVFVPTDKDQKSKEISETLKLTEAVKTAKTEKTEKTAAREDAATETNGEEESTKSGTLTADGSDYRITLDYTPEAKVPEGASLSVREITAETDKEAYEACMEQAAQKLASDDGTNVDRNATRFFDIEIVTVDEDGNATKIEPAAPVSVRIQFMETAVTTASDAQKPDPTVLHFAEEGIETINSDVTEN